MKKKKTLLLVVLLMAVGFAAVSTTLYINGQTKISANDDDFNVYYSDAKVNRVQDLSVITDETNITFTTTLETLGEKYVLDYDVTNGSKNYDAEVTMECTQGNEYLTVTNEFDTTTNLEALKTRSGKLTLELKKSYAGEEDLDVTITCSIDANAIERDSLGQNTLGGPFYAYGEPTTASVTDYTTLEYNVFTKLNNDGTYEVCANANGLFCLKNNDYDNSLILLKEHFGEENCTFINNNEAINCTLNSVVFAANTEGSVSSSDYNNETACYLTSMGDVYCL